uniref:Uncharacterized protein LOC100186046 n=1 Tax=Phallusia mammillata TaxID=59560 RepID=A0A6F9DHS6_9ASCI|nr:uncharacterized protein LOC100186046 [Phallusia mammillata]
MQSNMNVLPLWVCRNLHDLGDEGLKGAITNWTYYSSLFQPEKYDVASENTDTMCYPLAHMLGSKQCYIDGSQFTQNNRVDETTNIDEFRTVTNSDYQITMKCTCHAHHPKSKMTFSSAALPLRCTFQEKRTHFYVFPRARHKWVYGSCNYGPFLNPHCLGLLYRGFTHAYRGFLLFLILSSILHPVHSYHQANATSTRRNCETARITYTDFYTSSLELECLTSHPDRFSTAYYNQLKFCARNEIVKLNALRHNREFSNTPNASYGQKEASCGQSMSKQTSWNSTLFCNHFSWEHLLSCNYSMGNCNFSCNQMKPENQYCNVERVLDNDYTAYQAYVVFRNMFRKYATPDNYSIKGNESECLHSYKSWICAQRHKLYGTDGNGTRAPLVPCDRYCREVEASCPFFRIFNRTKLRGGQPTFICKGYDIENPAPPRTKGCHYFELANSESVNQPVTRKTPETFSQTTVYKIRNTDQRLACADCNSTTLATTNQALSNSVGVFLLFSCFTTFSICVFPI